MSGAAGKGRPSAPVPKAAAPEIDRKGTVVPLRLAIGKDGLGIELAAPARLACADVVELVVRLPRVRFPFDVTGGVARFRHRRGELERVAIEIDARRAARWAEPLLRGMLGTGPCSVTVALRAFGATVTIACADTGAETAAKPRLPAALAFELGLVATPELALSVSNARGVNLPAPATLLALRATTALVGRAARREGARFVFPRAAERIARALLPDAGVRAPSGPSIVLAGSGESDGVLFVAFAPAPTSPAVPAAATLANEAALLLRDADEALLGDALDHARRLDLAALERAPRHPEIARRIAEIDAHVGSRAEAAVATLRGADRALYHGSLLGDLLAEMGDTAGAIAALLREGERDPSPIVAALVYARAATLATSPADALAWLDAAVARAPVLADLRWERARRRLVQGRIADARADFQELEAIASGAHDRYEVLRRAGDLHRASGLGADAAMLYERALLYRPDDPETMAGLGVAIAAEGRAARGATLLARAIEIASAEIPPRPTAWMDLALGRVLGDGLQDRPAAVARLRAVPDEAAEAIDARGLEGRYRAAIGDVHGASLAFARLRERAGREASALPWLEEAALFEEERGETALAQAHLGAALAIAPRSEPIGARYRAVSTRVGAAAGVKPAGLPAKLTDVQITLMPEAASQDRMTVPVPPDADPELRGRATEPAPPSSAASREADEARVEALTRTLQGDPTNDAVVDELGVLLGRLGRSMELLALLSARLEDATSERRAQLLPAHRAVLEKLEREARAAGRVEEADLFRMARDATGTS